MFFKIFTPSFFTNKLKLSLLTMIILLCFACKSDTSRWQDKRLKKELEVYLEHYIDSVKNDPDAWQNKPKSHFKKTYSTNNPGRSNWNPETWSEIDSRYMSHYQNGEFSIIYSFAGEHHGAEFVHVAVFNKKRDIKRYFTNNQYIRLGLKGATDSTYSKVVLKHYLDGWFIYNMESGLISKCFKTKVDPYFQVELNDSVTLLDGEKFYISSLSTHVDERRYLYGLHERYRNAIDHWQNTHYKVTLPKNRVERRKNFQYEFAGLITPSKIKRYLHPVDFIWFSIHYNTLIQAFQSKEIIHYIKDDREKFEIASRLNQRNDKHYKTYKDYIFKSPSLKSAQENDFIKYFPQSLSNTEEEDVMFVITQDIYNLFDIERLMKDKNVSSDL